MSRTPIGMTAILCFAFIASPCLAAFPGDSKAPQPRSLSVADLAGKIDAFIEAELAAKGVEPAPLASDAEFMRRVYLDLAGRIPSERDVRAFLADKSPDKRAKLVEALLGSDLYVQNMADNWQSVMGPGGIVAFGSYSQPVFRLWLETSVRENAPYDRMVRELFTSQSLPIARNPYAIYGGDNLKILVRDKKKRPVPPNSKITADVLTRFKDKAVPPNGINSKIAAIEQGAKIALIEQGAKIEQSVKIALSEQDVDDFRAEKILIEGTVATGPNGISRVSYEVAVSPGMYFFEMNGYRPENLAASTARRFLGVRLECAQCHNHPFASWSRKQFWEFATFFTAVPVQAAYGRGKIDFVDAIDFEFEGGKGGEKLVSGLQKQFVNVPSAPGLTLAIPGTDKVVKARFLDGQTPPESLDGRHALAEWLTSPSNPYFARSAANRLWAQFFGVGIIDPIDEEPSEENPASHPELLAELTSNLVASNFDVKYLIRAITMSRAYQRASAATHPSQNAPRLFARMAVRGIRAEQLWDNIALATGYQDPNGGENPDKVARRIAPNVNLNANIGSPARNEFVAMFTSQDSKTELQTSILQVLTLMNGNVTAGAVSLSNPTLAALVRSQLTSAEKIETLYLSTLSRLPRPEETARLVRYVEAQAHSGAAFADVLWALLNCAEFRFNQ